MLTPEKFFSRFMPMEDVQGKLCSSRGIRMSEERETGRLQLRCSQWLFAESVGGR
jgi:hypothetical protein